MAMAATSPVLLQFGRPCSEVELELIEDHFPLLLVRWSGQLAPQHVLRMIRFFDAAALRARDEQRRVVLICDARDAGIPNALVRDMLADWLIDRPASSDDAGLIGFVIANDPLIRGVVSSLKWATGRGDGLRVVSTLDEAIAGARDELSAAGLDVPDVLTG